MRGRGRSRLGASPQKVGVITYTSPAPVQEQSHDRGRFGNEEGGDTEKGFFFFGGWGRGGRRVMVGMMMSLAGKTAELGVFRSFILTAPTEIDTYSLPYHRGTPPPPRNTLTSGCP